MHIVFEPLDFIGEPAALLLLRRANPTRFRGFFALNSRDLGRVVLGRRG